MPYTPVYVTTDDYDDIRVMLGLEATSTSPVSDDLIERRMFLPAVERLVEVQVEACEIVMDDADADYDADAAENVIEAVLALTAAKVAERYLKAAAGGRVKAQSLGPASVTFDAAPDWHGVARDLHAQGCDAFGRVCEAGGLALYEAPWAQSDWEANE